MSLGSSLSLDRDLLERVMERLEIPLEPEPSPTQLWEIYAGWCRHVPFDNVQKMIHVRSKNPSPLPGSTPTDYFESWLRHGTGGTCWAGSGALHALLSAMGYQAERALGTMLVAPDIPPNHGSVRVRLGDDHFLLDTSILHHEPLHLIETEETRVVHPAWGVTCFQRGNRWHVQWRPMHKPDGFECRFEGFGIGGDEYRERYEQTRGWSPFNYQVCIRRNIGEEVTGLAFGNAITLKADGTVSVRQADDEERVRILIEEMGLSEEIVGKLPKDIPTPPPPGSHTAQAAL